MVATHKRLLAFLMLSCAAVGCAQEDPCNEVGVSLISLSFEQATRCIDEASNAGDAQYLAGQWALAKNDRRALEEDSNKLQLAVLVGEALQLQSSECRYEGALLQLTIGPGLSTDGIAFEEFSSAPHGGSIQVAEGFVAVSGFDGAAGNRVVIAYDKSGTSSLDSALKLANNIVACKLVEGSGHSG